MAESDDGELCPGCQGSKVLQATFVRYMPGYEGPPIRSMPCTVCDGVGWVTAQRLARLKLGEAFRAYRVESLGLGLRAAAVAWGLQVSELSAIEQGRVATDWVPPGFKLS